MKAISKASNETKNYQLSLSIKQSLKSQDENHNEHCEVYISSPKNLIYNWR